MSLNSDANLSDIVSDVRNIISSDTNEIHLSKSFVDEFGLNKKDFDILSASMRFNSGMTEYECEHFVADTQLTPWRKVRQALMELETRYHAYMENRNSLRKAEILRKKLVISMDQEPDELNKELMQIDLEKNDYDISIWKRKLRQSELELKYFLNVVDKYVDEENGYPLEYFTTEQPHEVKTYWIARMGKQAAMDIVSYGRIGAGNMTSIMDMPEEDQVEALGIAVKYSGMIGGGIDKLNQMIAPQIQAQLQEEGIALPKLSQHKYSGQLQFGQSNNVESETP
tara:strand:+ start:2457 stop:3305 length:849 start_codon:yes stop_codon:yes gene_type:complete